MKKLFSSLALVSILIQPTMNSSRADNTDPGYQTFTISQPSTQVTVTQTITQDQYETQTVPDTCYRDVQEGTKEECHTEYDHQCQDVSVPVCQSVPRQECHTVPGSCTTQTQCTTVDDSVCNSQGCTTVPRRVCNDVQSCSEDSTQCDTVNDSVCHDETQQQCTDVPRQACEQVPNIVSEPYACTKDVQVYVGTDTLENATGKLTVVVSNYGDVDVSKDEFNAKLDNDDITLSLSKSSGNVIYKILDKKQTSKNTGGVNWEIDTTITVQAIPAAQVLAFKNAALKNVSILEDRIRFQLPAALNDFVALDTSHINLKQVVLLLFRKKIADQDFKSDAIKAVGDHYEVSFADLGLSSLKSTAKFDLALSVGLKPTEVVANLVNPEIVTQSLKPLTAQLKRAALSK